ncbi:hypothetical protein D8B22_16045 [Verminephrobacter aporrectodeae subsp. tuberculatae]|uniref:hypothetical protein n=1 Tax=Verminephrobacter aporrectodeae TaxID=1110389 RepID=UPI00224484A1|nr:hypothetical protein [Verminephrobacter aporrectodeae]MCW8164147.1 hypothetical protein [Verminephrobacter aporrectodeae subsp. tuberculatae]MCW8170579.1 hypothetical protein [Verminephrobacter aporrectodeae subsp. tuberculatae]
MNRATFRGAPQQGQALVEFLTISAAVLGLFLLMPMIGKYQDIAHATHMASRYAAFDATVHNDTKNGFKPEAQLAEEVRRRYFSNPDAPIRTGGDAADDSPAHQNPLWSDPRGKPLIRNFSDVEVTFGKIKDPLDEGKGHPTHNQAFMSSSDGKPFSLMPLANHKTLDLQARGIYRVNVTVPLANLPEGIVSYTPFDKIDLRITRHTSVLIDPWAAESVQQTMDRFGKLVPLNSLFSPIEAALGIVIPLFELGEVSAPQFGRLERWQDVVPEDRLKADESKN